MPCALFYASNLTNIIVTDIVNHYEDRDFKALLF